MRTLILTLAALLAGGAANAQPMTVASHSLSQSGATRVLQAAEQTAARLSAPSAIAVVNADGLLLAFIRMDDVRPAGGDLAIGKARTAALLQRPTAELEENVAKGRVGLATVGLTALRGGAPLVIDGAYVGAVGVAGRVKEQDAQIAQEVAAQFGAAK